MASLTRGVPLVPVALRINPRELHVTALWNQMAARPTLKEKNRRTPLCFPMAQDNPSGRTRDHIHGIKPKDLLRERLLRKKPKAQPAPTAPEDPNQAYAARMTEQGLGDHASGKQPTERPRTADPQSLSRVAELAARSQPKPEGQAPPEAPVFDHREQDIGLPSVEPLPSPTRRGSVKRPQASAPSPTTERAGADRPLLAVAKEAESRRDLRKTTQIPPRSLPEPLRASSRPKPSRRSAEPNTKRVKPATRPAPKARATAKSHPPSSGIAGAGERVKNFVSAAVLPPGEELSPRSLIQAISAKSVPILERMGTAELGPQPSGGKKSLEKQPLPSKVSRPMVDTVPGPPTSPPPDADFDLPRSSSKPKPPSRFVDAFAPPEERRPRQSAPPDDGAVEVEPSTTVQNAPPPPVPRAALSRLPLGWIAWGVVFVGVAWFANSSGLGGLSAALGELAQALEPGAAFQVVENFEEGVSESWLGTSPRGSGEGLPLVADFGLHSDTLDFVNYRFEFEMKILRNGGSWAVRGVDEKNYYGFRLVEKGPENHVFERFIVVDGERTSLWSGEVKLAGLRTNGYRRVSARVMGDSVSTFVDGLRVDYFRDTRILRGGAGFVANRGDQAQVKYFSVSGNQDSWGLFVYGTVQTLRSAQSLLGPKRLNAEANEEGELSPAGATNRQAAM